MYKRTRKTMTKNRSVRIKNGNMWLRNYNVFCSYIPVYKGWQLIQPLNSGNGLQFSHNHRYRSDLNLMSSNHIEKIHYLNFDHPMNHSLFHPFFVNEVVYIVHDQKSWILSLFYFPLGLLQVPKMTLAHTRKIFANLPQTPQP